VHLAQPAGSDVANYKRNGGIEVMREFTELVTILIQIFEIGWKAEFEWNL
jgi:hypothetical protein